MTSTYSNLFFSFLSRHLTTFFDRNWIKINSIWNKVDKIFLKKKSSYNSIKLQVHNGTQSDGIINVEKKRQGGKNKTNPWAPNFFVSRPHFLFREIPRAICNYFSFRSKRRRRRKKKTPFHAELGIMQRAGWWMSREIGRSSSPRQRKKKMNKRWHNSLN